MRKITVGILRETKNPPDKRVAVAPKEAALLTKKYPELEIIVQSSSDRCYRDDEYQDMELPLQEDISNCDILIGVKEVKIEKLIPNKKYIFFSHTAKKQDYNRPLLQALVKNNIQMIDHEYLTDEKNIRLVAFGRWAGIVGAYNGLIAIGKRTGRYSLKRAKDCFDMQEMLREVDKVDLPNNYKILITGGGRVAQGALETLAPLNLKVVTPGDFLTETFNEPVICRIDPDEYVHPKTGDWISLEHFFNNPAEYKSTFKKYAKVTDCYIACHFWDQRSPVFLKPEDYLDDDFKIKIIADVSCDIAGRPVPSTLRASTIAEPFYGYNPKTDSEADAWDKNNVTVMAVDNLPGELPRDASDDFGKALAERVFPAFLNNDKDGIIYRATICKEGKLAPNYEYLQNFLTGKE